MQYLGGWTLTFLGMNPPFDFPLFPLIFVPLVSGIYWGPKHTAGAKTGILGKDWSLKVGLASQNVSGGWWFLIKPPF